MFRVCAPLPLLRPRVRRDRGHRLLRHGARRRPRAAELLRRRDHSACGAVQEASGAKVRIFLFSRLVLFNSVLIHQNHVRNISAVMNARTKMCFLTRVNPADMMTFSSIQVLLPRVLWKTSDSCAIGNVNIATMTAQNRDRPAPPCGPSTTRCTWAACWSAPTSSAGPRTSSGGRTPSWPRSSPAPCRGSLGKLHCRVKLDEDFPIYSMIIYMISFISELSVAENGATTGSVS